MKVARRETALSSARGSGCVDGAAAQEEEGEERCGGRASCLNTREREEGGGKRERSERGEKSFRTGRRSEPDGAGQDTEREKDFPDGGGGVREHVRKVEEKRTKQRERGEVEEEEEDEEEEREGKLMNLILGEYF